MDIDKEKLKALVFNPSNALMGLSLGFGTYSAMQEAKSTADSAYNALISDAVGHERAFLNLSGYFSGEVTTLTEVFKKANAELRAKLAYYVDNGFDMILHPQGKVLELIPPPEYVVAKNNIGGFSPEQMKSFRNEALKKHLLPTLVGSGVLAYGPKAYNAIKERIAEHSATKKVASILGEELENRHEAHSLEPIISSVDIQSIINRVSGQN
jgi:hypothetical protein